MCYADEYRDLCADVLVTLFAASHIPVPSTKLPHISKEELVASLSLLDKDTTHTEHELQRIMDRFNKNYKNGIT